MKTEESWSTSKIVGLLSRLTKQFREPKREVKDLKREIEELKENSIK